MKPGPLRIARDFVGHMVGGILGGMLGGLLLAGPGGALGGMHAGAKLGRYICERFDKDEDRDPGR